jgi:hypothetical protein
VYSCSSNFFSHTELLTPVTVFVTTCEQPSSFNPLKSRGKVNMYSSIATGYRLDDRDSIPAEAKDFSSSLSVQTSPEAHPASCLMCTGGHFPGVRRGRGVTLNNHPHLVSRFISFSPCRQHGSSRTALYYLH